MENLISSLSLQGGAEVVGIVQDLALACAQGLPGKRLGISQGLSLQTPLLRELQEQRECLL